MSKKLSIIVMGLVLAVAGCSSTPVKLDYDPEADFNRYATYDWLDNRPGIPPDVKTEMNQYPAVDEPLRKAVSAELAAKGLAEDQVDPNILVAYHVGTEDDIEVTGWGYRYSDTKTGWGRGMDVVPYRKGTLVIDVIEARTMRLVWRASGHRALNGEPSQSAAGERIAQAVGEMFQAFPAK